MTSVETWGLIISVVGLTVSIVLHLVRTSIVIGKLINTLDSMTELVKKLEIKLDNYEKLYMLKSDAYRELGKLEGAIEKAHTRVDELLNHNGG